MYDSATKTVLFEDKTPFPEPLVNDGVRYTVSAEKIAEKIRGIFRIAEPFCVKRAFFSVQMHGYILKNDTNLHDIYVSWRDKSGNTADGRFKNTDFSLFGTSLKTNLPLTKVPGDKDHEFFTLGSYIVWDLTGNNATHITDAAASGFFFADGKPNGFAGRIRLPRVDMKLFAVGSYNNVVIYSPVGDHQASFLGSGAENECYLVNIGTATQVSCLGSAPEFAKFEPRPYFYRDMRLCTVSGLTGGSVLYNEPQKVDILFDELISAFAKLPKKRAVLFGGGGADAVYEKLRERIENRGYICKITRSQIGTEGLIMLSENTRPSVGVMHSEIPFVNFPIIAKNEGLDFVLVDNEHGAFDASTMEGMIVTANLIGEDIIVRVGDHSRAAITRLADMGAHGFLLPMTDSAEDIRTLVEYAKYTPVGKRGVSTNRAHTLYSPPPLAEYIKSANEKMKVYAQIETRSGMENLKEILDVAGVDGIFIGPNDLSMDLGCVGDSEKICACIESIAAVCNAVSKPFGIITSDKKLIDCAINHGASMVSVGSELSLLKNGCKRIKEMFL